MDNNNLTQATQPAPAIPEIPPMPVNPNPNPAPQTTLTPPSGGGKMKIWILVGLIVLILISGGAYLYLNSQKTEESTPPESTSQIQPITNPVDSIESETNAINVESDDSEFTSVDTDLKSL